MFDDCISNLRTIFSKVHRLNGTKLFVSKTLINRSSELETKTGAHLISYGEIKGVNSPLSGRTSATSKSEAFSRLLK